MPDVPDIIRIRTTLTSDTPHLPELAPLVGRRVEVIVLAEPATTPIPEDRPPTPEELAIRAEAMEFLRNSTYDWDAWREQRNYDQKVAEEELRQWQSEQAAEGRRP